MKSEGWAPLQVDADSKTKPNLFGSNDKKPGTIFHLCTAHTQGQRLWDRRYCISASYKEQTPIQPYITRTLQNGVISILRFPGFLLFISYIFSQFHRKNLNAREKVQMKPLKIKSGLVIYPCLSVFSRSCYKDTFAQLHS